VKIKTNALNRIVTQLKKYKRFLILSHISPEGDAIGSQLALRSLLRRLGKTADIMNESKVPPTLLFLPGVKAFRRKAALARYDAVLVLDCATLARVGRSARDLASGTEKRPLINIDHHVSNSLFGAVNWVEDNASSVGEMIFYLAKKLKLKLTRAEALCLYAAILTDSGSFHYASTSPATHRVAAELLESGIKPHIVFQKTFQNKTFSNRKLLGFVLSRIRNSSGGKVAAIEITPALLKRAGAGPDDANEFVNYLMETAEVEVAAVFSNLREKGWVKVNLRSRGRVDVNVVARRFGGGGHRLASGCLLKGSLAGVRRKVLSEINKRI